MNRKSFILGYKTIIFQKSAEEVFKLIHVITYHMRENIIKENK